MSEAIVERPVLRRWNQKWREEWKPLLGTKPDAALAEQWGVSVALVAQHRREAGILFPRGGAGRWKPEWDELLGTVPDAALVDRLGVTLSTIRAHRTRKGILPLVLNRSEAAAKLSDDDLRFERLRATAARVGLPIYLLNAERKRRQIRVKTPSSLDLAVVLRRAALAGMLSVPGVTLKTAGEILGVTRERARQYRMEIQALVEEQTKADR